MKSILISAFLLSLAAPAFAGNLDGLNFCRKVQSDGSFGQPKGERLHCLSFENNVATDNANTFFGNPPERFAYGIKNSMLINKDRNQSTGYSVQRGSLLQKETGAVLTIKK